jgi:phage repressor protein C with HTH and peptisase S24 domain
MFKQKSNTTFNNTSFNKTRIGGMHKTTERLYLAAKTLKNVTGQSAVARLLNTSPQTVKNWEARGVSKGGMVDAERAIGCRSSWIETGDGDMEDHSSAPFYRSETFPTERLLPSSDTQPESFAAESPDQSQESAMLLKFPPVGAKNIGADDHYNIPQYQAGGAMGHGLTLPEQPGVIQNWSVSREWLNKNVRNITGAGNLCIVTGFGHSMQPMFNPGDPLLVDTGVSQVIADGIYFFRVGEEGFIKQLQKIPTAAGLKYVAKSKNTDFDPFEITPDMDFEVLGKVVRVWCGTDF